MNTLPATTDDEARLAPANGYLPSFQEPDGTESGSERAAEWAEIDAAFEELAAATQAMERATKRVNRALGATEQRLEVKQPTKSHMTGNRLSPEVADVIRRATIIENRVVLPPERLDAKLYQAVNKALVNAGGKWNTRAQAHVFASDPSPKIAAMLDTGVAVNEKKKLQAFYTPPELAAQIAQLAEVDGCLVLEPSAGHGALADACRAAGAEQVQCVEMDDDAARIVTGKGYSTIRGDFLGLKAEPSFDRVVMNPPFTKDQDVAHVRHALMWLKPNGILVAVMGPNKDRKRFKDLIRGLQHEITEVPAGAFKASGTNVATLFLKVWRAAGAGVSLETSSAEKEDNAELKGAGEATSKTTD